MYLFGMQAYGFNLSDNRQIRGLNYGICVHSKTDYCSIEWSKTSDPFSFSMSGNSSWISTRNLTGEGQRIINRYILLGRRE